MYNRKLHESAYDEWKENTADEYAQAQRRAFLAGFEAAAQESREFGLLRQWLADKRDEAEEQHTEMQEMGDGSRASEHLAEYHAYLAVLLKLSEIGIHPNNQESPEFHHWKELEGKVQDSNEFVEIQPQVRLFGGKAYIRDPDCMMWAPLSEWADYTLDQSSK